MDLTQFIPVGLVTAVVFTAAVTDLRTGRLPNALTYSALAIGLGVSLLPSIGPGPGAALLGVLAAFVPAFLLFAVSSIGGGDVKLLTAVGALVGYPLILDVMFFTVVAGGALALSILIWKGRLLEMVFGVGRLLRAMAYPGLAREIPVRDLRLPMAVAIAIGTLWVLFVPAYRITALIAGGGA